MPQKVYLQVISYCCVCPNFYFDNKDEEYRCSATTKTICNPNDLVKYTQKKIEWEKSQKTFFPIAKEEHPKNPYEIPEWCPLEDYQRDDLK